MRNQAAGTSARAGSAAAGPRRRLVLVAGVVLGLLVALPALASAAPPPPTPAGPFARTAPCDLLKATSSREAQQHAIQSIPFDKLDPAARAKVSAVLADVSLFRRMPVDVMECDPELYLFLLEHPDVVVNIWQVLGISRISMKQTGPNTFQVTDDAGTVGTVEVLYRDQHTHVIFTEGSYNGPLFGRQLQGRVVIVLKTGYIWRADGHCYVTSRLDSFTQIDNIGVEILTKTIQPLVVKTADLNFIQTANFVGSLSRTAEVNQDGLRRLAMRLALVEPHVRAQFAEVIARVGQKAALPSPEASPPAEVAKRPAHTATR